MNQGDAVRVLEDAIHNDLATITTAPTEEQREAMESVFEQNIAPRLVCSALDMEPGATWGQVVAELREDIATA